MDCQFLQLGNRLSGFTDKFSIKSGFERVVDLSINTTPLSAYGARKALVVTLENSAGSYFNIIFRKINEDFCRVVVHCKITPSSDELDLPPEKQFVSLEFHEDVIEFLMSWYKGRRPLKYATSVKVLDNHWPQLFDNGEGPGATMYQDQQGRKYNVPILGLHEHEQSHRFSYKVQARFRMLRDGIGGPFRLSMGVEECWFNVLDKAEPPKPPPKFISWERAMHCDNAFRLTTSINNMAIWQSGHHGYSN